VNDDRDLPEEWSEHDETLADQTVEGLPPEAARRWLLEQRFVHGLLRAMNTDAGTREARVDAILDGIAVRRRVPALLSMAAALLLLAVGWVVFGRGQELPKAEACVSRAIEHLQKPLDRRFHGSVRGKLPFRDHFDFTLTARSGMRFLIDGDLAKIGCDGTTLWLLPALPPGMKPFHVPLAQRETLLARLGDVLDLGYLDVEALLQRLSKTFELKVEGREAGANGLGTQVRMLATPLPGQQGERIESMSILFDEADGMVTRLEIHARPHAGALVTTVLEYVGTVELPADAYQVPQVPH
jgi:hypothetical protein